MNADNQQSLVAISRMLLTLSAAHDDHAHLCGDARRSNVQRLNTARSEGSNEELIELIDLFHYFDLKMNETIDFSKTTAGLLDEMAEVLAKISIQEGAE